MKKIIFAIALFSVLGVTAQSKDKRPVDKNTPEMKAKSDVEAMNILIPLDQNKRMHVMSLMTSKHNQLKENPQLSIENRNKMASSLDKRLEIVLGKEDFEKYKANQELHNRITN